MAKTSMTKAEEIKLLESIKEQVMLSGSDLYLESLFTDEFVHWVSNKIQDDMAPDMHQWLKEFTHTNAQLQLEVRETKHDYAAQLVAMQSNLEDTRDEIARLIEKVAKGTDALGQANAEVRVAEQDGAFAQRMVNSLQADVLRLKAELYDYQRQELDTYKAMADDELHQAVVERLTYCG